MTICCREFVRVRFADSSLKFVVTRFEKREEIEDRDREIWNKITRNSLKIVVTYVFFHGI